MLRPVPALAPGRSLQSESDGIRMRLFVHATPTPEFRALFTRFMMTVRTFALFAFAFSPSMLVMAGIGWYTQSAWWFGFVGLPMLFGNGVLLFIRPWRTLMGMELDRIAGRPRQG